MSQQTAAFINVSDYSSRQKRSADRVLESLDAMANRLGSHYAHVRDHERKQMRGQAVIRFQNPSAEGEFHEFVVYVHNVSSGGICFIYPGEVEQKEILVGLKLNDGPPSLWFQGEVVRVRQISEEDFWEFGVAFRGRLEI